MQSVCGGERREEMPQDERGEGCRHCVCHLCVSQNEEAQLSRCLVGESPELEVCGKVGLILQPATVVPPS